MVVIVAVRRVEVAGVAAASRAARKVAGWGKQKVAASAKLTVTAMAVASTASTATALTATAAVVLAVALVEVATGTMAMQIAPCTNRRPQWHWNQSFGQTMTCIRIWDTRSSLLGAPGASVSRTLCRRPQCSSPPYCPCSQRWESGTCRR